MYTKSYYKKTFFFIWVIYSVILILQVLFTSNQIFIDRDKYDGYTEGYITNFDLSHNRYGKFYKEYSYFFEVKYIVGDRGYLGSRNTKSFYDYVYKYNIKKDSKVLVFYKTSNPTDFILYFEKDAWKKEFSYTLNYIIVYFFVYLVAVLLFSNSKNNKDSSVLENKD